MKLTLLGKTAALIVVAGVAYGAYRYFVPAPTPGGGGDGNGGGKPPGTVVDSSAPGRSKERPLRVGVVTWPGYAGGIVANNGFKPNNTSIYGNKHNLWVEFTLQEDIDVRNKLFAKGGKDGLDIVWSTVDFWANELPGLLSNGVKAKAVMQVDWSQGGDAIVGDQSIQKVEDLRGKKIALAQFTPSHWLLEYNISNSLDEGAQREVYNNLVFKTASPDALADFVANKVDAAVVWEPDVEASKQRANSHVIISTKTVTNLIADVMVAREDLIQGHPDVVKDFVEGWLDGTVEANRNPDKVVQLLMENEPVYKDLGAERTKATLPSVKYADMGDNTLMFGLAGGEPRFDQLFAEAGKAWTKRGYIKTTVPSAQAKDDSFLKLLYKEAPPPAAAVPEPCGPKPKGQPPTVIPALTKKVDVRFASGSDVLDVQAKKTLNEQVKLFAETFAGAYINVEGNTDNVGNPATNQALSQRRAQAVVNYLVQQYKCYPERFIPKGNGDKKPDADNTTAAGRARNRRTDIAVIPVQ